MLKILLFLLLLVPLAGSVMATTAPSLFPYQYQETTLPNGLKVILIPMKNAGLVSYFTVIHAGSRNEIEPGKSGFAHFFEHIMFKGTEKYPGDVRNTILTEMGADTNAYTSDDMTIYYLHFPDRYLEKVADLESDRFMNLKYSLADFQTEARAVLGEYNKNFANPFFQLEERLRDVAFDASSYKHTTMGFVKDIQDMPNQYEYSLQFFKRFYRPDNATLLITGNFDPAKALELVKKYYTPWQGKAVTITQPVEPAQKGPRTAKVDYPGDTLPIFVAAYKAPAFVATSVEEAALSLAWKIGFGETSPLYQQLVLKDQKVDLLAGDFEVHRDPYLFTIYARIKNPKDIDSVRQSINATVEDLKTKPTDAATLTDLKSNVKYGFLMSLDTSRNVASQLAAYLALTHGMTGVNQIFETYQKVTPEDIQKAAQKYLVENGETMLTLTGGSKQ